MEPSSSILDWRLSGCERPKNESRLRGFEGPIGPDGNPQERIRLPLRSGLSLLIAGEMGVGGVICV